MKEHHDVARQSFDKKRLVWNHSAISAETLAGWANGDTHGTD